MARVKDLQLEAKPPTSLAVEEKAQTNNRQRLGIQVNNIPTKERFPVMNFVLPPPTQYDGIMISAPPLPRNTPTVHTQ